MIDDMPSNIDLLSQIFEAEDCQVFAALTGQTGQAIARRSKPNLILLDVLLSDENGFDVCRSLKQDDATAEIPVIFITAKDDESSRLEGFRAGGVDYIGHPVRREEVVARACVHLKIHRLNRELCLANDRLKEQVARCQLEEEEVRDLNCSLELRVKERTAELQRANENLLQEIAAHQKTERELTETELCYRTVADFTHDWEYWEAPMGALRYCSPSCEEMTGYSASEFIADPKLLDQLVHPEDADSWKNNKQEVIASPEPRVVQFRIRRKDGVLRWVEHASLPVWRKDGGFLGIRASDRDITDRKQVEEALRESEMKYRSLFESSRDAIMTLEPPSWMFTSGNPATVKMFEAKSEVDLTSHGPWELSPERQPDGRASAEKAKEMIEMAMREGSIFFDWTHRRIGGEVFPATVLLSRMEAAGKVFLQATVRDVTEQKRSEAALRESEARLRLAVQAANIGSWDWNLQSNTVHFSPEWKRHIGYRADDISDHYDEWQSRVHPDDLERTLQILRAYLDHPQGRYGVDFRFRHKDGSYRWVYAQGSVLYDTADKLPRMLGCHIDITERKQAEEALAEKNRMINIFLDAIPSPAVLVNRNNDVVLANQAAKGFGAVPGASCFSLSGGKDDPCPSCPSPSVLATGQEQQAVVEAFDRIWDTRWIPVSADRYLRVMFDITALKRAERNLRYLVARLSDVREEERTRIAREIHDELGQQLTGLKMDLHWIERNLERLDAGTQVNSILDKVVAATELADETVKTVQHIATELRPGVLDRLGLVMALHYEAGQFHERTGVDCRVQAPEEEIQLAVSPATELFRIFQAALTNITRHAEASVVEVTCRVEARGIGLEIHDNGCGISEAKLNDPESLGLLGMRERARAIEGRLIIERHPEGGTVVRVWVPRTSSPEAPI